MVGAVHADAKELKAVRLYVERPPLYRLDWLPFLMAYCFPAMKLAGDLLNGHTRVPKLYCLQSKLRLCLPDLACCWSCICTIWGLPTNNLGPRCAGTACGRATWCLASLRRRTYCLCFSRTGLWTSSAQWPSACAATCTAPGTARCVRFLRRFDRRWNRRAVTGHQGSKKQQREGALHAETFKVA